MTSIAPSAPTGTPRPTPRDQQRARERAFAALGGVAAYLETVERLACTGDFTHEEARAEVAWARQHQANLDAAAKRAAEQKADAARVDAEWSRMHAAWQAQKLDEPDARKSYPGSFFDVQGATLGTLEGLADFAAQVDCGDLLRRDGADEETRMCRWWREQGETVPVHLQDGYVSGARHWVLAVDTERVVPPGLSGARLAAWAADWRDSIAGLKGAELVVYAVPGKNPAFVSWWPEPLSESQASEWCTRLKPPTADDDRRFEPIRAKGSIGFSFPWRVPCTGMRLPSAHASAELPRASALATASPATRLVTGIDALDRLFRGRPGIPLGARVVVSGPPKNLKTLCAGEIADAARRAGWCVWWLAIDEQAGDITIRRLQRAGLSPAEAIDMPSEALLKLDAQSYVVTSEGTVEDTWQQAHEHAAGAPLLVVLDSLQTVPSAAAMGKSGTAAIEATIDAIVQCQTRWPSICLATSEITRDGSPKGSGRILYTFTTHCAVRRDGERLKVTVGPSRHNAEAAFVLAADLDGQRLRDPEAAALAAADAELWGRMRAVLVELGAASQNELERRLGGKAAAVRACRTRHVAAGDLVMVGQKFGLKCVP